MFCFCTGTFAKHSWVTGGFPMKWAGVTGRSDFMCLFICLYVQCGSTFWQQTVTAHYFCFVLKAVNKQQTPTISNKKDTKYSEVISPPGCRKHPGLRDAPSTGQQKGMSRRRSRGKGQKWLPKRGRQQGLQQGHRELQRGRALGDHTLCCINSQISSLWKWHRQPKLSLEWCPCLEQVYINKLWTEYISHLQFLTSWEETRKERKLH